MLKDLSQNRGRMKWEQQKGDLEGGKKGRSETDNQRGDSRVWYMGHCIRWVGRALDKQLRA